jgi:hypothetical protein
MKTDISDSEDDLTTNLVSYVGTRLQKEKSVRTGSNTHTLFRKRMRYS